MSTPERSKTAERKRPPLAVFIMVLFFALLTFYQVTQSPRFESYRTVDVVRLVLAGAGFGVVLTGLMVRFLRPSR